jgi:hypothetical protein
VRHLRAPFRSAAPPSKACRGVDRQKRAPPETHSAGLSFKCEAASRNRGKRRAIQIGLAWGHSGICQAAQLAIGDQAGFELAFEVRKREGGHGRFYSAKYSRVVTLW